MNNWIEIGIAFAIVLAVGRLVYNVISKKLTITWPMIFAGIVIASVLMFIDYISTDGEVGILFLIGMVISVISGLLGYGKMFR